MEIERFNNKYIHITCSILVMSAPTNLQTHEQEKITNRKKKTNHRFVWLYVSILTLPFLHLNSCRTHCILEVHRKHDFCSCFLVFFFSLSFSVACFCFIIIAARISAFEPPTFLVTFHTTCAFNFIF